MKIKKYIVAILAAAAMVSCSEEGFTTYEPGTVGNGTAKSGICFQKAYSTDINGNVYTYTDYTTLSFSSAPSTITKTTVYVPVSLMGDVTNENRPFKLTVDSEKTTAVAGVHYDLADSACYMPAGKAKQNVPIVLYRHEDLLKNQLAIVVKLEPNENFTTPLEKFKYDATWNSSDTTMLSGTVYTVYFSEKYSRPSYWNSFGNTYFSTWSAKKEKMINEIMNWKHSDWNYAGFSGYPIAAGKFPYAARKLREKLQAAADAGDPIYDEDGSFMQLGSSYLVDYSKYMQTPTE